MKAKKLLKSLGKNILAFAAGGLSGGLIAELYVLYIWVPIKGPEVGLGVIALVPALMVILGIVGAAAGGIVGVVAYNTAKRLGKR